MAAFPCDVRVVEEAQVLWCEDWTQGVPCPFPKTPYTYLEYARLDLDEESERGNLNAYHNAKRALDCQLDWVLWNLGLYKRHTRTSAKFSTLASIHAEPPKILQRLIKNRNFLEHEYRTSDRSDAEDAVDIAELFIYATKRLASVRTGSWRFWSPNERIGGQFQFAYADSSGQPLTWPEHRLSVPSDTCAISPVGINYSFYASARTDRLDPDALLDKVDHPAYRAVADQIQEVRNMALPDVGESNTRIKYLLGLRPLGESFVPASCATYLGLLRAIVAGLQHRDAT